MIKYLGALLVMCGCGGSAFRMVSNQKWEEHTLEQLLTVLEYMECELRYRLTPLPVLCREVYEINGGWVGKRMEELATELDNQIAPDASVCMNVVLARQKAIPSRLYKCLQLLGDTLGRFDLPGQLKGLEAVKRYAGLALDELRKNKDVRLRSYQTLGLCAGAAIVVLFL